MNDNYVQDGGSQPLVLPGLARQFEVYEAGLNGVVPAIPIAYAALEQKARESLPPESYDYVAGGAASEDSMRENLAAFQRWRIVPRMLRDVSRRDLTVELLGDRLPSPFLLAPIGVQGIVHPDAELAVARAASSLGVPIAVSTVSSKPMEQVAEAMGTTPAWFQLYTPRDRELAASLLSRAEKAGYRAIIVTLDTHILGWRPRDLQRAFLPFLRGLGLTNYFADPVFRQDLQQPPERDPVAAIMKWTSLFSDSSLTWEDLDSLQKMTRLPMLLKGILHPDDAMMAVKHGMAGIIVSNHGGRQVDGAIAALDALPDVVRAVDGRIPVLFDSGIRGGSDAFKALALGAKAVLLGRPYIWGLAVAGEAGVREVIQNFLADFDLAMALSGCDSVGKLDSSAIWSAERTQAI